jgi:hypothetical protein
MRIVIGAAVAASAVFAVFAGQSHGTVAAATVAITTSVPETDGWYRAASVAVTITGSEPGEVEFIVDGGTGARYRSSSATATVSGEGRHIVDYRTYT